MIVYTQSSSISEKERKEIYFSKLLQQVIWDFILVLGAKNLISIFWYVSQQKKKKIIRIKMIIIFSPSEFGKLKAKLPI